MLAVLCALPGHRVLLGIPLNKSISFSLHENPKTDPKAVPPPLQLIDMSQTAVFTSILTEKELILPLPKNPPEMISATENIAVSPVICIAVLQLFGTALILIRFLLGMFYTVWLCRRAVLFEYCNGIPVLSSDDMAVPAVLGIFRPKILLPGSLCRSDDETRLRLARTHEWAHLRHGDLKMLAFWQFLLPLLVFQPLFWILKRYLRREQEFLADAAVADSTRQRNEYAEELLRWMKIYRNQPRRRRRFVSLLGLASMIGICEQE
jgi:hypothetical protein